MRNVLAVLFGLMGGWFVAEGVRSLLGDGVSPSLAELRSLGLGPWTSVAEAIGLDPAGWVVAVGIILSGLFSLAAAFTIIAGWGGLAYGLGVVACVTMLWYAPVGTFVGVGAGIGLVVPAMRVSIRGKR